MFPPFAPFVPQFLSEQELGSYSLPSVKQQADIITLVQLASGIIDESCGRVDGDGNGSLCYTTYVQRMLLPTRNRNLIYLPYKPIVGLSADTIAALQTAATGTYNTTYTGVQPASATMPQGQLSGIIACSGRYGYTRSDRSIGYPDLFAMINPLNLVTMFGGPAPWVPIDVSAIDYDNRTGETWLPAGLQLQAYSEILITYTAGFNPLSMPYQLKQVCASLVKNAMAKGDATTALMSMSVARAGANFTYYADLLDPVLDRYLTPFRSVRAY